MNKEVLFTIGHSNRSIGEFVDLLKMSEVTAVADVRSHPFSRHAPHFNREQLSDSLRKSGIAYVFLGMELGARREEKSCYIDGHAKYELIEQTPAFQSGLDRIRKGVSSHRVAIMCAEKDPLMCHRSILVSRILRQDFDIRHIVSSNEIETQEGIEQRLLRRWCMDGHNLFHNVSEQLEDAYRRQAEEIEYVEPNDAQNVNQTIQIFTIGFTKKSAEEFFTKLNEAGVQRLLDVRLNNSSQLAGFAKQDDLRFFLNAIGGIEYEHVPELVPTKELLDAYKKHGGDWEVYEHEFLELMAKRKIESALSPSLFDHSCLLCSEHLPQQCHRRLVVEYLDAKWDHKLSITHLT